MDPWKNCTASLSDLERDACSDLLETFGNRLRKQLLGVDASQVTSSILAGVIVGIGACGRRYSHHPFTSFIYLGATVLFLPIISYVVSISAQPSNIVTYNSKSTESFLLSECRSNGGLHLIWVFLYVQNILINTSTVVAMDIREGPNIRPPFHLLAQGVWAVYLGTLYLSSLVVLIFRNQIAASTYSQQYSNKIIQLVTMMVILICLVAPFTLTFGAKILLKYYAFRKAQQSFEFGQNPLVVFGYMQQLQQQEITNHHGDLLQADDENDASSPPPLLITGEGRGGHSMEMKPSGYVFKDCPASGAMPSSAINNNTCSLVTLDRVWQLYKDSSMLHPLPISRPQQLKDLCLSFALFKLLRCRLARYKLTNAGSTVTLNFFWRLLLKDGQHARVFGVIADELSFVNDYYNSSFTISYSKSWLPILSTVLSFLSCMIYSVIPLLVSYTRLPNAPQLVCSNTCIQGSKVCKPTQVNSYGNFDYFVWVPTLLFFALVIVTEVRDMVSYICSNWTKIVLIRRTANIASSQQHSCLRMQKCVGLLLRCRCKLLNHWDRKMGQCSVLVTTGSRTTSRLRYLLRLGIPDQKRRVKVPEAVKVCIITALRSSDRGRRLSNGTSSLGRTQDGERLLWACNGEGTCDTILTWHIATCIFEVKDPYQRDQEQGSPPVSYSDHKIAAIYLSRYCVYLVAKFPELLPDNDVWIKSLYKAVKKDVENALAGHAVARSSKPEDDYQKLVHLLTENSKHEVLKNGVELAKQLVEKINDEETAWKLLADFWSEMILFVAPSDNLKGHLEAIARGGELITLLWALLFHAGIVSRPGEEDGAAAASSGAV